VLFVGVLSTRTELLMTTGRGAGEPLHSPAVQTSLTLQWLPSLQDVPSGAAGLEQSPDPGLHVPATWHWSLAVQTTGVPGWHVPPPQTSPIVQALPSLHEFVLFV
jgi:hypothetical protein